MAPVDAVTPEVEGTGAADDTVSVEEAGVFAGVAVVAVAGFLGGDGGLICVLPLEEERRLTVLIPLFFAGTDLGG